MGIKLQGLALNVTYACNLKCAHCFFSPSRRGDTLSPAMLRYAMESLREELSWVHLTGGEPLLDPEALIGLLEVLHRLHLGDIGIATNGCWAADADDARQLVARLTELGVTGICVSVDALHQPGVSVETVTRGAEAVAAAGLSGHSYLVTSLLPEHYPQAARLNGRSIQLAKRVAETAGLPIAETEIRPLGRATNWQAQCADPIPSGPCRDLACCLGETGAFEPQMVWIDPFGNVMICYGLAIGSLAERSLQAILDEYDPAADPVLDALAHSGPKHLFDMARERGVQPVGPFAHECDLCFQCRRALRPFFPQTLLPDECYP